MTTLDPASGRLAATRRPLLGLTFSALAGLLCVPSAFAATGGLAADSADQLRVSTPLSEIVAAPAPVIADQRPILSAEDVNALIAAQAAVDGDGGIPSETSGRIQVVLQRALALLGTPYRWGGISPDAGFDCSGLVGYVFRTALGIDLPRVSRDLAANGEKVDREALNPGDLVFFNLRGKRVDHVGIYLGNGKFVHAPRTGRDVTVSSLAEGYWNRKYQQARRVPGV